MKKLFLLLTATTTFVSCNKVGENEFLITGNIENAKNGQTVILEKQDEKGQLVPVDTVKIENGKFELKGNVTEPSFHLLQIQDKEGKIPFILENGEIKVIVDKDSIHKSKISGTYNNDEFSKFNIEMVKVQKEFQKKMMAFQQANMQKMQSAQQKKDTLAINQLMKEYQKIEKEGAKFYINYAESHPKAFISSVILDGMLNGPETDVEKIKKIYNNLEESLKNTKIGKSVKSKLDKLNAPSLLNSPEVGNVAPDFKAPNPEGKVISLKESLGKVTIIDFWASWCGPCRAENPNVVALYKEFHSKGLNIIGVSLDEDKDKWKAAISKDHLMWTQISNLKEWDEPIASLYNVKSIPATFILDAKGTIVAKDLRGEELKAKIQSLLNK